MRLRFLGTGSSFGIPVVGCRCDVCRSEDPRNRRTRHGLLIQEGGTNLLVDTPPELRLQLVEADVRRVDAVYLTHAHADHVHGIDDLRIFGLRSGGAVPVHVAEEHRKGLRSRFPYVWSESERARGTVVPDLELVPFRDREPTSVAGFEVVPVGFPHGGGDVAYGFRLGELAVVVDAKEIPEDAVPILEGARVLAINALWFGNPHPLHFNVEEAVEAARRLGAERTYLTHLTHRVDHREAEERLPEGVRPAHDGLTVEV